MGALRLDYFQKLFGKLNLGPSGTVTLIGLDGRLIARHPFHETDLGRDMSGSATFRNFTTAPQGTFAGTSSYGVRRLYTFKHVGDLPLILSVAVSVEEIYSTVWHKGLIVGSILLLLCGATLALCLLFRREMLRRMAAESRLIEAAEKMSVVAATDGLTGLANRRAFDTRLQVEWRRAIRTKTPIALRRRFWVRAAAALSRSSLPGEQRNVPTSKHVHGGEQLRKRAPETVQPHDRQPVAGPGRA